MPKLDLSLSMHTLKIYHQELVWEQERIIERKGRGKECEAPTHVIEISELTHATRITKNSQTTRYMYVAKKSKPKDEACRSHHQALSKTVQGLKTSKSKQ